jgi:parallel beta-helix repeat protein
MIGGPLTANRTLSLQSGETFYTVTGAELVVYNLARLTIGAGITVRFASGTGLIIGYYNYDYTQWNNQERGALTVNGTSGQPVVFTSLSGASGGWKGLAFGAASDYGGLTSSLSYLTVERAGQGQTLGGTIGSTSAGITLFSTGNGFTFDHVVASTSSGYGWYLSGSVVPAPSIGSGASGNALNGVYAAASTLNFTGGTVGSNIGTGLLLTNTGGSLSGMTISGNGGFGIDLTGVPTPTISGNAISGSGQYAIRYPIASAPSITANTVTGNTSPGIEVIGGALTSNHSWNLQSGEPYFTISSEIVVYNLAALTVAAGVQARFASGAGLVIGYYAYDYTQINNQERGRLQVDGTYDQPVRFSALSGVSGGWKGIAFGSASDYGGLLSVIRHAIIDQAGQSQTMAGTIGATSAGLILVNTTVALQNSIVAHSSGSGIYSSGSAPDVKNTIVAYNAGAGLSASGGGPSFTYGDVFANGAANSGWTAGLGSITADPLFAYHSLGIYRLPSGSPCVDTGTPIAGRPFLGAAPDMGVFEYGSTVGVPDGPLPPARDVLRFAAFGSPGPRVGVDLTLPSETQATIEVFDISGRRVAVLHEGPLASGSHHLLVPGDAGNSGVLFVRAVLREGSREVVRTARLVRVR